MRIKDQLGDRYELARAKFNDNMQVIWLVSGIDNDSPETFADLTMLIEHQIQFLEALMDTAHAAMHHLAGEECPGDEDEKVRMSN